VEPALDRLAIARRGPGVMERARGGAGRRGGGRPPCGDEGSQEAVFGGLRAFIHDAVVSLVSEVGLVSCRGARHATFPFQ